MITTQADDCISRMAELTLLLHSPLWMLQRAPSLRRSSGMPILKEKRYIFDKAFEGSVNTQTLYEQSVRVSLLP